MPNLLLDGGVKDRESKRKNAGFTIVPADGSYKVSFWEDEFVAFFKEFLRPGLVGNVVLILSKYYCLIAGLPNISLDDSKLTYSVSEFRKGTGRYSYVP